MNFSALKPLINNFPAVLDYKKHNIFENFINSCCNEHIYKLDLCSGSDTHRKMYYKFSFTINGSGYFTLICSCKVCSGGAIKICFYVNIAKVVYIRDISYSSFTNFNVTLVQHFPQSKNTTLNVYNNKNNLISYHELMIDIEEVDFNKIEKLLIFI